MDTKVCKKCGDEKPLDTKHFVLRIPANRRNPHWESTCKACIAADKRKKYADNPAAYKTAMRKHEYGIDEYQFNDLLSLQKKLLCDL